MKFLASIALHLLLISCRDQSPQVNESDDAVNQPDLFSFDQILADVTVKRVSPTSQYYYVSIYNWSETPLLVHELVRQQWSRVTPDKKLQTWEECPLGLRHFSYSKTLAKGESYQQIMQPWDTKNILIRYGFMVQSISKEDGRLLTIWSQTQYLEAKKP